MHGRKTQSAAFGSDRELSTAQAPGDLRIRQFSEKVQFAFRPMSAEHRWKYGQSMIYSARKNAKGTRTDFPVAKWDFLLNQRMRIAIFTVCRRATVENGRLSIIDAYGGLVLRQVPARAEFTIATRMFFSAEEEGEFSGAVRVIDPDGQQLAESAIKLDVPIPAEDATGIYVDSVGAFSLTIRSFGEYQFHFVQKNQEPFVFPLYVSEQKL